MPTRQSKFVHELNIRHFQKRLETETDPRQRALLEELISEEWNRLNDPPEFSDLDNSKSE